jgi:DNA-binding SARP family transcriptional activator
MKFGILGPLSVTVDGQQVAITAGRDRVVLAMLLLHPGRTVGVGELIDAIWGGDPPATARGQLQTCISRLRRTLPAGTIRTDPAGYEMKVADHDLDATQFARLVAAARAAAEPDARRNYRLALDLWRGPALVEFDIPAVRLAVAVLDERLALVTEDWVELELAAGHEREMIGELAGLVERFPLRERLRGQLMIALYRSGRQADALAEYGRARTVLRDELGIDPGAELVALHQRLLTGDLPQAKSDLPQAKSDLPHAKSDLPHAKSDLPPAANDRPAAANDLPLTQDDLSTVRRPAPTERVRCLPRPVADFTGRADAVERLLKVIEATDPAGPAVAMIDGMAGSGKTTLALHVATLIGDRYPDAHLFVDLQGHGDEQPVEPAAALLILLRQLGIDPEKIPAEPIGRVALWRTELARRQALVIFDNAFASAQLAELLPTSPGSLALITSRRRLSGLDGVHPESLPMLAEDEAIELLGRIAGERVWAEPEAAAAVVQRCGGLALAIRLAGARLAHRPRWRVADLMNRLGGAVLPELVAENRSLASAFALSYGQLTEPLQRTFRLLGWCPGATFDTFAVAALTGRPLSEARDLLDDLVDVHLVEEPESDVFRLHDLLREFAVVLGAAGPRQDGRDAVVAVLDFQLHAVAAAIVGEARRRLDSDLGFRRPLRADLLSALDDPVGRLERERPNLAAFVEAAGAAGHPGYAWQIPRAAWWYLFFRGYNADLLGLCHQALGIAERAGDRFGVAVTANYLSSAYVRSAANDQGRHYLRLSIRIQTELGNWLPVAVAMGNLASVQYMSDQFADAVQTSLEGLRVMGRTRGNVPISLLSTMGSAYAKLGRYDEALRCHRLRFLAAVEARDTHWLGRSLMLIQEVRRERGTMSVGMARRYLRAALRLFQRGQLTYFEADARSGLACLLRAEGRFVEAIDEHQRVLGLMRTMNDRRTIPEFLCELGTTLRLAGDLAAARSAFEESLRLARSIPLPYCAARAEAGLAECLAAADPAAARLHWSRAYDTFTRFGTPERFEVAKRLTELDHLRQSADRETMEG